MTTREKAHALLDELSDAELGRLIEVRHEEPEMAELPESWRTFEDGTPVPNWVAAVDEARRGRLRHRALDAPKPPCGGFNAVARAKGHSQTAF